MWSLCNEVLCKSFNATSAAILKGIVKQFMSQLDSITGGMVDPGMSVCSCNPPSLFSTIDCMLHRDLFPYKILLLWTLLLFIIFLIFNNLI